MDILKYDNPSYHKSPMTDGGCSFLKFNISRYESAKKGLSIIFHVTASSN